MDFQASKILAAEHHFRVMFEHFHRIAEVILAGEQPAARRAGPTL